ncbi:response regulator transcription factor [Thalassococcus sp. CAU 1522]|uniref:Response regulator transcription factor n=1 Tax=Thalassococcus arenae TaxID=2851652 RepID=A0ABS6N549_9RHOB|nr:response regulator transcription factor [Thalassococcus arenae]MBV2359122.1 response regulator transcription factor [Thalassococcus arenae]
MADHCILVVDDDPDIRGVLREALHSGGYNVCEAATARETHDHLAKAHPVLVMLDLSLGHDNGLDVVRDIRKMSRVPIIIVSGRDEVVDRVVGLELGADDYITKPFHLHEVLARVRALLRRTQDDTVPDPAPSTIQETEDSAAFRFDDMVIVPDRFELYDRAGALCDITATDFKLLTVFMQNAKRVMSRDRLMDLTGGTDWSPLDRTIDNQVARLRKTIERNPADPRIIKTVRGVGYTFASEVDQVRKAGGNNAASRSANSR